MIVNSNYRGQLAPGEVEKIDFGKRRVPPVQRVIKLQPHGTMLVFPSGKYRLMGMKGGQATAKLPYLPATIQLQSCTVTDDLKCKINLIDLSRLLTSARCYFEPEIFPGLKLIEYKPICVNVFSTGKLVLLGVKDPATVDQLLLQIKDLIFSTLADYYMSLI